MRTPAEDRDRKLAEMAAIFSSDGHSAAPGLGFLLGLITLCGPLAMNMYVPAFPLIAADLRADPGDVQLSMVSFFAALAVGQNLYGPVSDRLGRKGPLLAGMSLFVAASLGVALSTAAVELTIWRFLQGLGACAAMAIPRAIVRDSCSGRAATRMISTIMSVSSVAPLIAPLAGTGLVAIAGWRAIFLATALVGFVCTFVCLFFLPESLTRARREARAPTLGYRTLLADPLFVAGATMTGMAQAASFVFISATPFVMMTHFGMTPAAYSLVFALAVASWAGGAQLAPALMGRWAATSVLRLSVLLSLAIALATLALSLAGLVTFVVLAISMTVLFGLLGMMLPIATVLVLHPQPHLAGSASALLGTIAFAGGAGASMVASLGSRGSELPMVATVAFCLALSAAAVPVALGERAPQPQ